VKISVSNVMAASGRVVAELGESGQIIFAAGPDLHF
jgi:hypothetical protein